MLRHRKSKLLAGVTIAGVALATMGAVAFACTTYQGKMTVQAGTTTSISQGDDNCNHTGGCGFGNGSMTFCSVSFGAKLPHGTTGQSITVSTGTTTSCTGTGQMQNHLAVSSTFDVNWINTDSMSPSDLTIDNSEDCMTWNTGNYTKLGTITTDSSGAASKTFSNLPAGTKNNGTYAAAVCISDSASNYGNQTPLQYT
jgi:hypothetical protein